MTVHQRVTRLPTFFSLNWLLEQKMSMVILSNVNTKEVIEHWDFKLQYKESGDSNTD